MREKFTLVHSMRCICPAIWASEQITSSWIYLRQPLPVMRDISLLRVSK